MSKRSKERCRRWATPGRGVCLIHGGGSRRAGPSHHSYKTGRYSKALKGLTDLKQKYEGARKDPELCSSADDIALLCGLMEQAIESIGRDGNPHPALHLQKAIVGLRSEFIAAADKIAADAHNNQMSALADHLRDLGRGGGEMGRAIEMVKNMVGYRAAVEHWCRLAEQARRTRETEAKRQTALAAVVTMDQYTMIMATIGEAIMRHCDRAVVDAIYRDLSTTLAGVADAPLAVGAAAAIG